MIPIVLHHGFMGVGDVAIGPLKLSYFRGIDRALAEMGHPLIVSRVHPTGSIERRAQELKTNILMGLREHHTRDPVIIVAHSMGGLDARYMLAKLGMEERVAGVLTICTPHRGSPYADWCLLNLGKRLGGMWLTNLLGVDIQAVSDLTTESCRKFNEEISDSQSVRYFSIGACRPWHRVPPFAIHAHRIITATEGDNDCLVSVESSKWGQHLGVWPADHFHSINHKMVLELLEPTGDITPYYLDALKQVLASLTPTADE